MEQIPWFSHSIRVLSFPVTVMVFFQPSLVNGLMEFVDVFGYNSFTGMILSPHFTASLESFLKVGFQLFFDCCQERAKILLSTTTVQMKAKFLAAVPCPNTYHFVIFDTFNNLPVKMGGHDFQDVVEQIWLGVFSSHDAGSNSMQQV